MSLLSLFNVSLLNKINKQNNNKTSYCPQTSERYVILFIVIKKKKKKNVNGFYLSTNHVKFWTVYKYVHQCSARIRQLTSTGLCLVILVWNKQLPSKVGIVQ